MGKTLTHDQRVKRGVQELGEGRPLRDVESELLNEGTDKVET